MAEKAYDLYVSQVRVLNALAAGGGLSRNALSTACGFTPLSGTLSTVLNGCREGSSSGRPRLGLMQQALVEKVELDVEDGMREVVYVITAEGRDALAARLAEHGPLPPLRDKKRSINSRYKAEEIT